MIVYAAIAPHSPLLLPTIGKEHQRKLEKTLESYKTLEEELYASKAETIVIISPHGFILPQTFSLFISPVYRANLKEFGDFNTILEFKSDLRTIEAIRQLENQETASAVVGMTDDFLDYGSSIPLAFLTPHLPNSKIVPLGVSYLSISDHFTFGTKVAELLQETSRRIAIVASADLSHTLTDEAPGGFAPEGKKFDSTTVQALRKNQPKKILALEEQMDAAKACGLRSISILLGILNGVNCTPEVLSYEGPFGVGYLTAKFNF